MSEEFIEMKGQPKRELERELALNYDLEQVVADLVDNSIDAGADNVWVIYNEEEYNNRRSYYVAVIDDGKGIPDDKISSVMDFGAPREYDELELGKFGVGMKSSSLSQAREITLISKTKNSDMNLRRLSAEIVNEKDKWMLLPNLREHMDTEAISVAKRELAQLESGSAVILEDMHKLHWRVGHEGKRDEYLSEEYGHIKNYLGMVFERYIRGTTLLKQDGSEVYRKVNLFFNGKSDANRIELLDPFLSDMEDGSVTGTLNREIYLDLDDGKRTHKIKLKIWITPSDVDRPDGYDDRLTSAGRDAGISEFQGLYFYRNDRLIDFPGWKKILKHEPHATCVRWEVHFPPSLDDVFQLDPSKREIKLPREIHDQMSKVSRTQYRWHMDDNKAMNHRARAKIRLNKKDKPRSTSQPTQTPSLPSGKPAKPGQTGSKNDPVVPSRPTKTVEWPVIALTKVKIKKLEGSITGQLFVSERTDGDALQITLNTKHGLYKEFIEAMKKE